MIFTKRENPETTLCFWVKQTNSEYAFGLQRAKNKRSGSMHARAHTKIRPVKQDIALFLTTLNV